MKRGLLADESRGETAFARVTSRISRDPRIVGFRRPEKSLADFQ